MWTLSEGVTYAAFFSEVMLQVTGLTALRKPYYVFFCTSGAGAVNLLWLYQNLMVAVDSLFVFDLEWSNEHPDAWTVTDSLMGAGEFCLVAVASLAGGLNFADTTEDVFATVPVIAKVCRHTEMVKASKSVSLTVLAGIDALFNTSICYINIYTLESSGRT